MMIMQTAIYATAIKAACIIYYTAGDNLLPFVTAR